MSVATATRHSETEIPATKWWVRDGQGGRYGPVDFEVLKSWARDGRIGPANDISKEGVEWAPATAEPALEMDWVAEVSGGRFYGPIHRDAVQGLINDGAIAGQAVLYRRSTLDTYDDDQLCRRLEEELRLSQAHARELEEQCRQARQRAEAHEKERMSLAQSSDLRLKEAEARLAQARAASEEALRQIQADVETWKIRCERTEADLDVSRTDARDREERFQTAERGRSELERRLARREAEWQEHQTDLQRQLETLQEACHAAQRERAVWQAETERALAEAADRLKRISRLEADAEMLRKTALEERNVLENHHATAVAELRLQHEKEAHACQLAAKLREDGMLQRVRLLEQQVSEGRAASERGHRSETHEPQAEHDVPRVEVVDAEPVADDAPKPPRPSERRAVLDAEVLPPERAADAQQEKRAPRQRVMTARPGEGLNGLSLAELERQAQRELERLGTHGPAFFSKKR